MHIAKGNSPKEHRWSDIMIFLPDRTTFDPLNVEVTVYKKNAKNAIVTDSLLGKRRSTQISTLKHP